MNEIKGKIPDMKLKEFYATCDTPDYNTGLRLTDGEKAMQEIKNLKENFWQKCPICQGSGKRFMYSDTGENHFVSDYNDCETCEGKRIISTITGKPPSDD